jgi:hypothetical protein
MRTSGKFAFIVFTVPFIFDFHSFVSNFSKSPGKRGAPRVVRKDEGVMGRYDRSMWARKPEEITERLPAVQ